MRTDINLPAYFDRIGYTGPCEPTLAVLTDLHGKHPEQIPFEGLDPFLGRPMPIDTQSIQSKLVQQRRGGYCFEHNGLFFSVLETIGFRAIPLAARVIWMSPGRSAPATHRLTLVHLPEGDYLADVGFGDKLTPRRSSSAWTIPRPHRMACIGSLTTAAHSKSRCGSRTGGMGCTGLL